MAIVCLFGIIVSKYEPESEPSGCCAAWLSHPPSSTLPCTATLPQAKTNSPVLAVIHFGFVCKRTSSLMCGRNKPGELMAGWRHVCLLRELLRLPWRQLYNVVPPNLFRCTAWFMSKYRQTSWSASREFLPAVFWDWVPNLKVLLLSRKIIFTKGCACFVCFS